MGNFFDAFNQGRQYARDNSYRKADISTKVRLVEPSNGKIVKLEVIENNECFAKLYLSQLENLIEPMKESNVQSEIKGKTLTLTFPDEALAEKIREIWKK